jgi:hypothetical protein
MKKSNNRKMALLIAMIASAGVVHAEEGTVEVPVSGLGPAAVIQELVARGVIVPLGGGNWYQINREKLNEAMAHDYAGDLSAHRTIEMLKRAVGPEPRIEEVDVFVSAMGSQDRTP